MLATSCDPPGLFSLQVAWDVEVFHGPHVKLEGFIDSFFIIQPAYSGAEFGRRQAGARGGTQAGAGTNTGRAGTGER